MFIILVVVFCFFVNIYGSVKQTVCTYYQCSEDLSKVITDGSDMLDLRGLPTSICQGYLDVCCNPVHVATYLVRQESNQEFKPLKGCGYYNSRPFSWTVSLHYQASTEYSPVHKCGASLIHPRAIITAAHCLTKKGMWTARLGGVQHSINKIILHRDFNSVSRENNIALLILKNPVQITDTVNTICLPSFNTTVNGSRCMLSSWKTDFDLTQPLKVSALSIIPKTKCTTVLKSSKLGQFFHVPKSCLCAEGDFSIDIYDRNGGSPLVCPFANGRYYQVGIASRTIMGYDKSTIPSIYVNLLMFRNWIDEQMKRNGFDVKYYSRH